MACVFCDSDGGEVVWQDALCRVVLPHEPGYPGFVRVIAQQHVAEMSDFSAPQRQRIMDVVWAVERVLRTVMQPHKINIASLGNMVPHVHWHVIARFVEDAHFPGSVWSGVQREPSGAQLATWAVRAQTLPQALHAALQELAA